MMKTIISTLCIILGFGAVILNAQPQQGGILTYCESEFPRSYDPVTSEDDIVNVRLTTMIYEGLFAYNINREIVTRLAEGYRIEADGQRMTVTLRRTARWSDGREVTAYDVRATVEAIRASGNQQEKRILADIADVNVRDNYTLTFVFDRPLLEEVMLRKLTFKVLPQHKLPGSGRLTRQSPIARDPLGSGFYQMTRRGTTDLVMQVNDHYRRRGSNPGPYIDEVRMYVQTDIGTQIEFLLNQQVDVLVEVPPPAIARLRASGFQIKPYESLSYHFIAFNFNHPILKQKYVRQAMTFGFNREVALDRIYQNQGTLISGPFPPSSAFYVRDQDAGPFPYDPQEAMRLLVRAGFDRQAPDGIRMNANGDRLTFTLIAPRFEGDDFGPRVVAQFVSDMRRIGIAIELLEFEFERWINRVKYEHAFDLAFAAVVFDEAGDITPLFLSTNNMPGAENFTNFQNPEVDELLNRSRLSTDAAERININRRLHRLLREECPFIFLWSLNKNAAAHQKVRNFMTRVTPFSFFDYLNEWYIREDW